MTIEDRLAKLEKELSRVKRRNIWLLVTLAICLGIGVVCTPAQKATKEIRANHFILEDNQGRMRAYLWVNNEGPILAMCDENGKKRLNLQINKGRPTLAMFNENGKNRLNLQINNEGPTLTMCDENGKNCLNLQINNEGPALALFDENGKNRVSLEIAKTKIDRKEIPMLRFWDENGKLRTLLNSESLIIRDENDRRRIYLGRFDHSQGLFLSNENGKLVKSL